MSTQGSIRKDNSGAWFFVIDTATPDGKRKQLRRRGFATKRDAAAEMAAVITDQNRGSFVRLTRCTLRNFLIDEWLPTKEAALKPSTYSTYAQMLRSYVVPHIGALEMSRIDGGTLNSLYARLLKDGRTGGSGHRGGLAPKTVRNVHGMLHRAFSDAVKLRRIAANPCNAADQPRKAEPEMKLWTTEQMRQFISSVDCDRFAAVWRLLLSTGMRRGELLGIRWVDVDLVAGRLTIRQTSTMVSGRPETGTPKSRAGNRTISLDPGTIQSLKAWRKMQAEERLRAGAGWSDVRGLVATEPDGSSVHPQVFSRRFKAQSSIAQLPQIRLHDTRHSYATAALAAGVPVKVLSQRLGHADVGVTLKIYAHVMPGDDEAAARLAADAIFG